MKSPEKNAQMCCSFCGRQQREVRKLIAGPTVYICDECVRQCSDLLKEEARKEAYVPPEALPTPAEIKAFLDGYVVGQDRAKRVLSVAVYNHYKRIYSRSSQETHRPVPGEHLEVTGEKDVEIQKSNVLLLGPTGSGKTLLAQSLARFLKVPFTIADATTLTEAGYVGEDVENIISNLLQNAGGDVEKCSRGIVYIDEIDKIASKTESSSSGRDVGGEGVQQALLKIVEGTMANVTPKTARGFAPPDRIQVDTRDILFICGGSFSGIADSIRRRVGVKGLGFGAAVGSKNGSDVGELLSQVIPQDIVKFGMIPEFVGRLPVIATLSELSEDDLIHILTEPKNALVKQYQKMFSFEGVKLTFTKNALKAAAAEALRRKGGARSLRSILESAMLDIMYDVIYQDGVKECKITEGVIARHEKPTLIFEKKKTA